MEEILYLVHRFPYPPNKGDKIRSYHLLRHLSQRYRIHLGTFIDDDGDWKYRDKVKGLCGETCFIDLSPKVARVRSLRGFFSGRPLTLPYYWDKGLQTWVNSILETRPVRNILVFSSAMAQYVSHARNAHRIVDFVDIDSDKWRQYANATRWPMNRVYRRESKLLLGYERQVAVDFDCATFVSQAEADLFGKLVPEAAKKVTYFNNGVDADYFSPHRPYSNPYTAGLPTLVFTGAMDYWANIDAVEWFARRVFSEVRAQLPMVEFHIVGARPTAAVIALASLPGVTVTGSVPDVRPFLAHASLVVVPLRIARGIQNKVLEAMAMEKIAVISPQAMEGIHACPGRELVVASDGSEFASHILAVLANGSDSSMGHAARNRVLECYSWEKSLGGIDRLLARTRTIYSDEEVRPAAKLLQIGGR
ncbi:TIGR03087 family PEP-CTERM/XrtA system glycosyltransferase [Nitrosovibrio tenuis]|uniref:Sugar transferase, PEP-CTERM/EpsH1 system associated n=1 Tax=Nitrosovibrio tenuis TaxID=1233 RepID=A0A1H7G3F6_9PROT|nr:TIGR03087 family PEP-CTERM/XrtA system glycosyltransferase [Nitrosovibrio tenuis]SEK30235.1 sugar transferase, PEP-CTERM/EpsH1 system associated [Nitrosovibrio tenuis]